MLGKGYLLIHRRRCQCIRPIQLTKTTDSNQPRHKRIPHPQHQRAEFQQQPRNYLYKTIKLLPSFSSASRANMLSAAIQHQRQTMLLKLIGRLLSHPTTLVVALLILNNQGIDAQLSSSGCPVTQFQCATTGRCVNLNVFCDGRNDCGDNSDEPAQCTHCNRTYYAATGESYRLLVAWPKLNQMPFLCHLTFTSATPQDTSQLLQIRLDTATIGQYVVQQSQSVVGDVNGRCPDGCMQIFEGTTATSANTTFATGNNKQITGAWCGASITPRFYYAESTSVTIALHLQTIPQSLLQKSKSLLMVGDSSSSLKAQQLHPILDLTYKVLPRSSAIVRYGIKTKTSNVIQHLLGEPVAGTMCSRSFRQCGQEEEQHCRVQSPGYPGIYPRNAHCLYKISHRSASRTARRYVIVLWQNDGRKINLRDWDQPTRDGGGQRTSRSMAECEAGGDFVTIYDGPNTQSAILTRFCDGPLPEVVSSSADVTVEFRSSALDTIYAGWTAIEGFELKVRTVEMFPFQLPTATTTTTSSDTAILSGSSRTIITGNNKCQWNVTSSGLSRGRLSSPVQTWPLRTTCHFRFVGRPDERVWIYFAKYHFEKEKKRQQQQQQQQQQQCRNALRIAEGDGIGWDPSGAAVANGTIRIFCRDTKPPPLCERQLPLLLEQSNLRDRSPPPCLVGESFVSQGSTLSVQQYLAEGTAFSAWKYVLAYEFFRETQDGQPLLMDDWINKEKTPLLLGADCNRLLSVQQQGTIELRGSVKSPHNVFLFGRGGARHLKCVYRFQGEETMRVAVEVTRLRLGGRPGSRCHSRLDSLTHQRRCHILRSSDYSGNESTTAFLQLRERPWAAGHTAGRNILLQRDCLCDTAGLQLPFRYVSTGSAVEVVFQVTGMTHADDYHDFFFEISYEFLGGSPAVSGGSSAGSSSNMKCASQSELKPLQGPGGIIQLDGLRGTSGRQNSVCNRQSWFLLPSRADRFFFLSTNGFLMNNQSDEGEESASAMIDCPTKNRIVVYSDRQIDGQPLAVICPSPTDGGVRIFSPTFNAEDLMVKSGVDLDNETEWRNRSSRWQDISGGVVIEFIAIQSGSYTMKWLELTPQSVLNPFNNNNKSTPSRHLGSVSSSRQPQRELDPWFFCSTWCPELKACIDSQLWCDGVYDCPSGVDESEQQCHSTPPFNNNDDDDNQQPGTRISSWSVPKVYWYLIAAGSTLLSLFVVVSSVLVCRNGQHPLKSPDPYNVDPSGLSPSLSSSQQGGVGGSFRPPPVAALNDCVYNANQSDNGSIGTSRSTAGAPKIVVGGASTKSDGINKVPSLYHYDKKMAVS